jgi:pyroglutamyl-peptidase
MKRKRLLITGFGPFPGRENNPSAALVRAIAAEFNDASCLMRCVVLKTEYQAGLKTLDKELKTFRPDIVISFGVAADRKGIHLETRAANRIDNKGIADAAGYRPRRVRIDKTKNNEFPSTLPLQEIHRSLGAQGIPVQMSRDAGGYLCNYVFYNVMKHAQKGKGPAAAGFVHIPLPDAGGMSEEDIKKAAQAIIRETLRRAP